MKKSFEILTQILPLIDAYETSTTDATVDGFLEFAHSENKKKAQESALKNAQLLKNQLGFYLNMLFRFMKIYTKTALKDTALTTIDDFIFLADIHKSGSIRKTDLIKNNRLETPSGTEIIKRLLKYQLISEHADTDDKRAVRVKITEAGRTELFAIFGKMNEVGTLLAGDLASDDLLQLHGLLEKLAIYHQKIKEN
jgi:MarR family transcriptional regulator, lower aerobic nicotinate degradation pathway regulator